MESLKEKKGLLIALLVVVIGSVVFLLYYLFLKPAPNSGLAEGGLVTEPGMVGGVGDGFVDDFGGVTEGDVVQTGVSGDLIMMLGQLQGITLENKFENQPGFSNLLDHSVEIDEREAGRENPFAPFEGRVFFSEEEFEVSGE